MIISVLGTACGIDKIAPTSSFVVDSNTLMDCGSGVETLSIERMLLVERILLTHAHLDHCSALPALLDCHAKHGGHGITVYSQQETIDALQENMFNEQLSPDFTLQLNPAGEPLLRFSPVEVGDALPLADGMATALPAQHSIPAIGWLIEGPWRALAYTGDSGPCPAFWHWATNVPSLSDVVCEITYTSTHAGQAQTEGHMTPEFLRPMLDLVPPNVHIWISHLDHEHKDRVLTELRQYAPSWLNIAELTADTHIDL
jgi:ribonuclease BN (tRNA processing enzyme)